jgi:hypothetical protein
MMCIIKRQIKDKITKKINRSNRLKCVSNPLHDVIGPLLRNPHYIESARRIDAPALKKKRRRSNQALLLGFGNRLHRRAIVCIASESDFDKNDLPAIPHDKIQFARSATVIALNQN